MLKNIVFLNKLKWFCHEMFLAYQECFKYETLSTEVRMKQSFEKRKKLLDYAYENCPFYKRFYDEMNFHPSIVHSEEDWKYVPILEKQMIRENKEDLCSCLVSKSNIYPSKTGGSTGEPLIVYKSKHVHFEVLGWRALNWYGVSPAMNEGIVHRRVPEKFLERLLNRVLWWPTKRAYLCATHVTPKSVKYFVDEIKRYNIEWLVGYCGSLEYIADYILKEKIELYNVKLIWSTSSPLTKIVRKKLETAFHCAIMDQYGCCEMGNIAIQKPNENFLTVNSDYVHIDIINGGIDVTNKHKYGDICITDLNTMEFPLIKYRLGDRSRIVKTMLESKDGFPKLEFVQGRISDMIYLPDNTYLDGSYLTTICDNYSEQISCYQIHQYANFDITFVVVLKRQNTQSMYVIQEIKQVLESLVKYQVRIEVRIVDKIEDFAGKRKFIISEIALSKLY